MDIHVKINQGRRLVDVPTSTGDYLTRIESPLFLLLLRRRLRHTLPLSKCICGCGHSTNTLGHHRTACSRTGGAWKKRICCGKLRHRGFAAKMAGGSPPICSGATWIWGCPRQVTEDAWRWSWTVCTLFGGVQLAVDASWVHSRATANQKEEPQIKMESHWQQLARDKERTHLELVGPGARSRLMASLWSRRLMVRGSQYFCSVVGQCRRQI